jgi:hypothetical protein
VHDSIAPLLFDHGFVAYNPQTGQALTDLKSLNRSYYHFEAATGASHGSTYYWLWSFIGINLLLGVLGFLIWVALKIFS